MRKEKILDLEQTESMSKVIPHRYVENRGGVDVVVTAEKPKRLFAGVPASAFKLQAIIDSGGSFNAPPKVESSPMLQRDDFDSSLSGIREEQTKAQIARDEARAKEKLFEMMRAKPISVTE